jgi:hypothetical protein
MADDLKCSEDGMKLHASLAKMLDEAFKAQEGVPLGALGLTMGGVIGAAAFVITVIKFMTSGQDREMVEAMKTLQRQIDEIKDVLVKLDRRLDELVIQVRVESPQLLPTGRPAALEPGSPCVLSVTHPAPPVQTALSRSMPCCGPLGHGRRGAPGTRQSPPARGEPPAGWAAGVMA